MKKLELNKIYGCKILELGNELTDSTIEGSKWDLDGGINTGIDFKNKIFCHFGKKIKTIKTKQN